MDIGIWAPSVSRSAEFLAEHPHLLDAGLARLLSHFAVALLLGSEVWRQLEGHARPRSLLWRLAVFSCGIAGAWLAVRTSALGVGEEWTGLTSVERSPEWGTYAAVLLETRYGAAWLAYGTCLALAVLPLSLLALGAMAGSLLALAATTHAAEAGLTGAPYWLHAMHLAAALAWLGGLALLCIARFGRSAHAELPQLRAFSRVALPLFLLAVVTGVLGLAWRQTQGFSPAYLAILGLKLAAVAGVAHTAWQLRKLLRRPATDFDRDYDGKLGTEIFFSALLLLAAALLTQLAST
jgi:putative copper export protein